MSEQWKEIDGWGGYQVSTSGRVLSPDMTVKTVDKLGVTRERRTKGRVLAKTISKSGYVVVDLRCSGRRKMAYVHRLVAEAFIPNPENKPQVNHIDGDKSNPSVDNLEWCSHKENIRHGLRTGLITTRRCPTGENAWSAKLSDAQVKEIKERLKSGDGPTAIAKDFPVGASAIQEIKAGRSWKLASTK